MRADRKSFINYTTCLKIHIEIIGTDQKFDSNQIGVYCNRSEYESGEQVLSHRCLKKTHQNNFFLIFTKNWTS